MSTFRLERISITNVLLSMNQVFSVNYLGGDQASFTLNFSKSASTILAQYYNFMRLGFEGYKGVMQESMSVASYLRQKLLLTNRISIVDKQHMPMVAWCLTEEQEKKCTVFELQVLRNQSEVCN